MHRTTTSSNRVARTATGPACTARATPLSKHFTPCAGSGPHRREGKTSRDPNRPQCSGESIPETGNPAGSVTASMKPPRREVLPKVCRETEISRRGLFRSPNAQRMIQFELDRLLPVKCPATQYTGPPHATLDFIDCETAPVSDGIDRLHPEGLPGSSGRDPTPCR